MAELLVRGSGWPLHRQYGAVVEQAAWMAHRRRKRTAAQVLGSQIHALADLAFPGLTGCFTTSLEAKAPRMLLATLPDPARVAVMTLSGLVAHAAAHQVRMPRPKAAQVITAAGEAMRVPAARRAAAAEHLVGEVAVFEALLADLDACEQRLAKLLPDTPAGVLISIPGVGVLTASYYAAALGDAHRFVGRRRLPLLRSGPAAYESAGRRSSAVHISRVGSVELRQAIIALGVSIAAHHPDFAAYRRRLREEGKKPMIASIAVAHRAHRLAFAILKSQRPTTTPHGPPPPPAVTDGEAVPS
ncbi:MAG TPA: transposase [Mycobacteriales bacterium]|nr:transposase [Mycobacteriales bacterium]